MTCPRTWQVMPRARRILAELDHLERRMDEARGLAWDWIVEAGSKQHCDLRCDLDGLRSQALDDFAESAGPKHSEAWDEAHNEADDEAMSVEDALKQARKLKLGPNLFQMEAA